MPAKEPAVVNADSFGLDGRSMIEESTDWFGRGSLHDVVGWLHAEGPNPFSCVVMGEFVSIAMTFVESKLTKPMPEVHLNELFDG